MIRFCVLAIVLAAASCATGAPGAASNPYDRQVAEKVADLQSGLPGVRAAGAESLGYLRARAAAGALVRALADGSHLVRREAAMSLAWCGGRAEVPALLAALDDADWVVRQAAWVALVNLTGLERPFDALAPAEVRSRQAAVWRSEWGKVPADAPPQAFLDLLTAAPAGAGHLAVGCRVTASTTYKGPPEVLTDGRLGPLFWQTKKVPFPQHCTVDLGKVKEVGCIVVHQYGRGFCMTDYAISTSRDGKTFEEVRRSKAVTPPKLVVTFPPRRARFIRITSYDTQNRTYPTTFREVEVWAEAPPEAQAAEPTQEQRLRAVRAVGALGGQGATAALVNALRPYQAGYVGRTPTEKATVQAALRGLGRLGEAEALPVLTRFLDSPYWARYAADALGDFGGREAPAALLAAYPTYAIGADGKGPKAVPPDDRPGFSAVDRIYETPFAIAFALARLPLDDEKTLEGLRHIAPLLAANIANDFDAAMLYEPEAAQLVTAYLLERAGMRQAACEAAFQALGRPVATTDPPPVLAALAKRRVARHVPYAAAWLPALCRDERDVPRLVALLEHPNGWARINAAKALMFLDARAAAEPIARLLAASKPEAEYGYCGIFLKAEYDDPAPRWREAYARALGRLGDSRHVPLLTTLLNDDRNVLEVQRAAAVALDEVGTPDAVAALKQAEAGHPFHSIRLVAREALWQRGMLPAGSGKAEPAPPAPARPAAPAGGVRQQPEAIVFIKGPNKMPNAFQIDIWRQTYSTTDSGPTYRVGRNLYLLRPAAAGGKVTPLSAFDGGYVADCEVSWDGRRILFARRGEKDPWWHVWEIGADGKRLRQLTHGPYHDVQPAYLPDGRIVFSSSRIGLRDEYHGYPATGLTVMNADGGDIHCIGFNLGRDNEPAILPDGRIVFSRLELFYSRLKTELTVQAVFPDGTRNVTLYGPERREFWRQVTRRSKEKWWGEAPPRHRVLRLTQPQPFDGNRVICATTGGLTLVGASRSTETFVPHDRTMAVTSPFPLGDGRVLCAATRREMKPANVDLGLYVLDAKTGVLAPLYNDPATADFEPRPVMPRRRPPTLVERPRSRSYTARLFCRSAKVSRDVLTARQGKLVRVIEGMPIVSRHQTHRNPGEVWRNHTGTHARILGTLPLGADGSFFVEVPADRLIHVQVLDSDRRVVGNQLIWMYARPGETRSCVGCHESPDTTTLPRRHSEVLKVPPVACLPTGGEFTYRAKAWKKGTLPDEGEERTRTVRAVNLLGRY